MARGLMACALKGEEGGVYNIATGQETSILDLANLINEFTNNKTPIDLKPAREWDRSGKRFASTEKSKNELGFSSLIDIREGINRTVEWTKNNQDLISQNITRHKKLMNQVL